MSEKTVLAPPDAARIRDELQALVVRDLYGPEDDEAEEFTERPTERYLLGRLAPEGTVIEPDDQDDSADIDGADVGEADAEPSAPNIPSLAPSSLGCTVYVTGDTGELRVEAAWSHHERVDDSSVDRPRRVWRRVPMHGSGRITLSEGELPPVEICAEPRVMVRGRARRHGGDWLVSLFLVNATAKPKRLADGAWLFQVRMRVSANDGGPVFLPRPPSVSGGDAADRSEQRRLAMAYRDRLEFAVGHSTAVTAEPSTADPARAVAVRTVSVPEYELAATDVPSAKTDLDLPELADLELDMGELAELPLDRLVAGLAPLVVGYRSWITRQKLRLEDPDEGLADYRTAPKDTIAAAVRAADRIQAGIELLVSDEQALTAFRFANRAMRLQRLRSLAAALRQKDQNLFIDDAIRQVDLPENRRWRPFQLAFLLLNLPSLADPAHPERGEGETAVADLLWFPTGGGKTEAYLGLTAFTLAIRRCGEPVGHHDATAGVAVLMRYTLRLLTIQQFQRATALICACETLRREDETTWGHTPFRIGLWVGARVTPNRTDDAIDWLKQKRNTGKSSFVRAVGSPHQLTGCPWCGETIDGGRDIDVDPITRRTTILCSNVYCDFSSVNGEDGLPVLVVDEEIYRLLPDVVIATVDKFAQLPWRGETQALFGRVSRHCARHGYLTPDTMANDWELSSATSKHPAKGRHPAAGIERLDNPLRPPDLIIQDELHLISGPLGSLVGLYETAVDRLAVWERSRGRRVRPKVIASTATVRRAQQQIGALFDRRTEIFPPPGLDIADSFFARQRPTEPQVAGYRPGRRYIGICAHGTRIKSALIRVYVATLGAAQKLHEMYGANPVTDPYMTLVGYFNSLRDLGGMRRMVEDDVSTRLSRADQRGLARRYDPVVKELTSRLSSGDIPVVLDHLSQAFSPKRGQGERRPIDVLLATNMIAVGVDVSRLGLMVVSNQPKSTAEYIQATSRVGRADPGLVFTVYNWARPRDLSHYETFEHFHATIYRHVEALSVTPFADRAVDRGLTGVLTALVRNLEETYNGNLQAGRFDRNSELADHVVRYLKRRSALVASDNAVGVEVERQLDARLDHWHAQRRVPGRRLAYSGKVPGLPDDVAGLLRRPEEGRWRQMTCPTSLQDVSPGIRLLLMPGGDDLAIVDEPPFTAAGPEQEELS
ncbi:DISARM system helicase DrmA [Sphaerisporangium sp. NPDC051017]|uniref:DISARM system helicase DrmA n=1 Tax=Sphaerisporangium sp. NPDC051017 TaxID=3154636 RepID=UPI00342F11E8